MARVNDIWHKVSIELAEEDIKDMLKSFRIPINEENIESLVERVQEELEEDIQLTLENSASFLADDLDIVNPDD